GTRDTDHVRGRRWKDDVPEQRAVKRFALAAPVVIVMAGCGVLIGNDNDPDPTGGNAGSDGGDGSSSAGATTAEGGASVEAGDGGTDGADGSSGQCVAANEVCKDQADCCPGLGCPASVLPAGTMICCAG